MENVELRLVVPTKEHQQLVEAYKEEFMIEDSSIDGSGGLRNAKSFDQWLADVERNSNTETVKEGLVPSSTYLVFEGKTLVGMVDLRHHLNKKLKVLGGHIGYSVRASQRRKGYATRILSMILEVATQRGMDRVLVTCDRENIASAKTIVHNDGVLLDEYVDSDRVVQRYWIDLFKGDLFKFYTDIDLRDDTIKLEISKCNDAIPEKKWLPAYYFDICLHDGTKIGFCDLRIGHNEKTYIGGNIGYGIDEAYRGNGYSHYACMLMFKLAKLHHMNYLIITCMPDNIASYKTIEKSGGRLIEIANIPESNEMYQKGERKVRVYRVELAKEE
jgi:tagatose 1,6-diphosphate aldolase